MEHLHLLVDCMYESGNNHLHLKLLQPPCPQKIQVAADVCVFEAPALFSVRSVEKVQQIVPVQAAPAQTVTTPRQANRSYVQVTVPTRKGKRAQSRGASVTRKTTRDTSQAAATTASRKRASSKKVVVPTTAAAPSQIVGSQQGFRLRSSSFRRLDMAEKAKKQVPVSAPMTSPPNTPLRGKSAGRCGAKKGEVKGAKTAVRGKGFSTGVFSAPTNEEEVRVSRSGVTMSGGDDGRRQFRSPSPSVSCLNRRLSRRELKTAPFDMARMG